MPPPPSPRPTEEALDPRVEERLDHRSAQQPAGRDAEEGMGPVVGPGHPAVRVEHEQADGQEVEQRVVRRDARGGLVAVSQGRPERVDLVGAAAHHDQRGQEREREPGDRDRDEGVHAARIAHARPIATPVAVPDRDDRGSARPADVRPGARPAWVDPVAAARRRRRTQAC